MPVFVPERKRSSRGELRVDGLLLAAARLFGKHGYHPVTTNAIAAEAGVSPATLYQFFPNKEAIADELATRYSVALAQEEKAADIVLLAKRPLAEAIADIMEIVVVFHQKHPAFRALLTEAPLSEGAMGEKHRLSETFVGQLAEFLMMRRPVLAKAEALWNAEICLTILKGFLPQVAGRKTVERTRSIESMNQVLVRFLEPIVSAKKR